MVIHPWDIPANAAAVLIGGGSFLVLPPVDARQHRLAGNRPEQQALLKGVPRPRAARAGRLGDVRVEEENHFLKYAVFLPPPVF